MWIESPIDCLTISSVSAMDCRFPHRLARWLLCTCLAVLFAGGGCIFTASPGAVQETGESDTETADAGADDTTDGGVVDAADATDCESKTDAEWCEQLEVECGTVTASNDCGQEREIDCGNDCPEGQTCGADEPNQCACPCEFEGKCLQSGESPEGRPCITCEDSEIAQLERGTACGDAGVCLDGRCMCEGDRLQECGGECVDTSTNLDHCGACNKTCTGEEVCEAGSCLEGCNDLTQCGGRCVDTTSNDQHCGDCNSSCEGCSSCSEGDCAPDDDNCNPCEVCSGDSEPTSCERRFDRRVAGETCQNNCACLSGSCRNGTCAHRMFVTSSTTTPNFGGASRPPLARMDRICQRHAVTAGLGGTWKALASSGATSAQNRLTIDGPIENMNGEILAVTPMDLWNGSLTNAVLYAENGNRQRGSVWTGTDTNGQPYPSSSIGGAFPRCQEWTSSDSRYTAMTGLAARRQAEWVENREKSCARSFHLYCLDGQQ
jgi:hypothetical protein